MNESHFRIGLLRRLNAAGWVGPVTHKNVTNDLSAIRPEHVVIWHTPRLQAGAVTPVWFDRSQQRWAVSKEAWLHELKARVLLKKDSASRRFNGFGGGVRFGWRRAREYAVAG